jgi:alpha-beta hydrolase superfamily lysophospholipase
MASQRTDGSRVAASREIAIFFAKSHCHGTSFRRAGLFFVRFELKQQQTWLQIIHGSMDAKTEPAMSQQFHDESVAVDKALSLYDGASHMLFVDKPAIVQQAMEEVAAWVLARVPSSVD